MRFIIGGMLSFKQLESDIKSNLPRVREGHQQSEFQIKYSFCMNIFVKRKLEPRHPISTFLFLFKSNIYKILRLRTRSIKSSQATSCILVPDSCTLEHLFRSHFSVREVLDGRKYLLYNSLERFF